VSSSSRSGRNFNAYPSRRPARSSFLSLRFPLILNVQKTPTQRCFPKTRFSLVNSSIVLSLASGLGQTQRLPFG
jgi:hypothetical protein